MTKIAVTGGSGKAGRYVVRDLLDHGYQVVNVDVVPPAQSLTRFRQADLTNLGEVFEALDGVEAVVHLAAIPNPDRFTPGHIFHNNTMGCYNVFTAAMQLKLARVVWASSETTLGLPFEREKPAYAPIDEQHPLYPEFELRPLQGRHRGDGTPVSPLDRHPVHCSPLLQRQRPGPVRRLSVLLAGCDPSQVEFVGLC